LSSDYGSRESLEKIRALVRTELTAVDEAIRSGLHSAVALVDQIADHIIGGGGKRLRPLLVVLAGRACGGADNDFQHSWNSSHQSRGCTQADLVATGGNGLFYCFAQ